jgi:hypothetical protein
MKARETRNINRRLGVVGFTLVEIAIVLVVAGLVISAVWVASETVWQNYRLSVVGQQIILTVQNIRASYTDALSLPGAAGTDLTETFDGINIFPIEMRRCPMAGSCNAGFAGGAGASPIDHAFDNTAATGSFHVFNLNSKPPSFRLQMLNVSEASCIKFLMQEPLEDVTLGAIGVGTGMGAKTAMGKAGTDSACINYQGLATNGGGANCSPAGGTNIPLPLMPATLTQGLNPWCVPAVGKTTVEVDIDFNLH